LTPPLSCSDGRAFASGLPRPAALDCTFETIREGCGFFETGPQCVTIRRRQRGHATDHQPDGAQLFSDILDGIDDGG
jgi:hypothetical protein